MGWENEFNHLIWRRMGREREREREKRKKKKKQKKPLF